MVFTSEKRSDILTAQRRGALSVPSSAGGGTAAAPAAAADDDDGAGYYKAAI